MTSIFLCFGDEQKNNFERWENVSNRVLRSVLEDTENERFKEIAAELDLLDDKGELVDYWEETADERTHPIYNFVHLLEITPKDEDVLEVCLKTNCSVIYDNENDKYYIALTGCGMDMSQDIAYAYLKLQRWIPEDFISRVCKQKGLTIGGEMWAELKKAIVEQSKTYEDRFKQLGKEWAELED